MIRLVGSCQPKQSGRNAFRLSTEAPACRQTSGAMRLVLYQRTSPQGYMGLINNGRWTQGSFEVRAANLSAGAAIGGGISTAPRGSSLLPGPALSVPGRKLQGRRALWSSSLPS